MPKQPSDDFYAKFPEHLMHKYHTDPEFHRACVTFSQALNFATLHLPTDGSAELVIATFINGFFAGRDK